jgi:MinD-like ATPase involved in chromosome partitioning or flagellar assembly
MSTPPVSVYLAGPDMAGNVMPIMFPAFNNDSGRFRVLSMAAEWSDLLRDVPRYRPEVVIVDALLAPDQDALRSALMALPAGTVAILVLPPLPGWADRRGQFEAIQTTVRGVFVGPANWAAIANGAYTAVVTERTRATTASPAAALYAPPAAAGARPGGLVVGTRTIAFTSFAGGAGRSSIAEGMAVELARNHVKSLLCSFNSPPAVVGHFRDLAFEPSAQAWFSRPTPEGFQAALQRLPGLDNLDILLAPNEPGLLQDAAARPEGLQNLIFSAYSFNYGAILLDLPPFADSNWAIQPILSANVAVIVCRPTVHDQFAAIRGYRLFTEVLVEQHRIPAESMFAVLNFVSPDGNMSEGDFHGGVVDRTKRFPPLLAAIPYAGKLTALQNQGDSPMLKAGAEGFAEAVRSLTGKLVHGTPLSERSNGAGKAGWLSRLGITIKVK